MVTITRDKEWERERERESKRKLNFLKIRNQGQKASPASLQMACTVPLTTAMHQAMLAM